MPSSRIPCRPYAPYTNPVSEPASPMQFSPHNTCPALFCPALPKKKKKKPNAQQGVYTRLLSPSSHAKQKPRKEQTSTRHDWPLARLRRPLAAPFDRVLLGPGDAVPGSPAAAEAEAWACFRDGSGGGDCTRTVFLGSGFRSRSAKGTVVCPVRTL